MTPSPALDSLRASTALAHARLESQLAVAAPGATRATYLEYIQDMHGWLRAFEQQLWSAPWPAEVEAASRAGKLEWIECDLASAGIPAAGISALPRPAFAPDLARQASRFGLAYVIEGSQLGTKELGRRLRAQLGDWEPRWLQGYGAATGSKWRGFLHALERHVRTPQEINEACAAAAAGFASLAEWFEQCRAQRAAIAETSET
ncbi:MAG TPA: biliverdin-producing heme oxygenase [Telluria sp.]|nr:biliverdin-producing heme oxygenase [Telluria sp.]